MYQGRKPLSVSTFPALFMAGLSQLLAMKGLDASRIDLTLQEYRQGLFAKTDSRKVLGSMNDLIRCYGTIFETSGGLGACDLTRTIMRLNDMPQKPLNWRTSWEVTLAVLAADSGAVH
jgi:hypothetical protein